MLLLFIMDIKPNLFLERSVWPSGPFRQQIWPPRAILVYDWLMLKKSSPLKLLGQMEPNLAGSIFI
jgi:hypothetical protein